MNVPHIERAKQQKTLFFWLGMTIAVRAAFAFIILSAHGSEGFIQHDAPEYIALAQSLLHGSFANDGLELFRTPGYPLFLVPGAALHHLVMVGILGNFLLAAASAWLVWRIVIDFCSNSKAATWAVVLYCFEPLGVLYSNQIMSEMLFCTLILLFIWLLLRYFSQPKLIGLMGSALVLAAATYVRPQPLYLPLWLTPLLLLIPAQLSWRRRAVMAMLFPAIFGLAVAPWIARNNAVADYRSFSSAGDMNYYFFSAAAVQAKLEHKDFMTVHAELGFGPAYFDIHPEQRNWSRGRIVRFWGSEARKIILSHPLIFALIQARGCAIVLLDGGASPISRSLGLNLPPPGLPADIQDQGLFKSVFRFLWAHPSTGIVFIVLQIGLAVYYLLALAGLRTLPRNVTLLSLWMASYLILVSGFVWAVGRYRMPIMPLVCISAGMTLATRKSRATESTPAAAIQG